MDLYKKKTVSEKAGESTQAMQATHYAKAFIIFFFIAILILLYESDRRAVGTRSLPGFLIIGGAYVAVMKILEESRKECLDLGDRAGRGTKAEEDVGDFLYDLPEGNFLIRDFDPGRGNIDHILISPNGREIEKDFSKQSWAQSSWRKKSCPDGGSPNPNRSR